jgi:Tol biopolymer transport system component
MLMPSANASRSSKWSEWSAPVNLGAGINTPFGEAGPAISRDGLTLYFVANRPGVPPDAFGDNDLYVARRESLHHPWDWPVNLGANINTAAFEGFPALSRDEHRLFFNRTPSEIWVSYRKNVHDDLGEGGWQLPVPLGPGVNTSGEEAGPGYFENRKRGLLQLFFSVRPVGGLFDIYVADAFGSAVPVTELNSTGNDARPSITADGLEIFFHSNRTGSAGNDLYSSVRKSVLEPWSEPKTLGTVVNSAATDFLGAISPDGETLFFTSTRDGGFGLNDIYMTTRKKHGRR